MAGGSNEAPANNNVDLPDANSEQHITKILGWKGPLPPPNALEGYDDVVEDGAERVFSQFEQEGAHRREMERLHLTAQINDMRLGKIFAFIFVMSLAGAAFYAIYNGQPLLAGLLGAGTLGSVVWAFVKVVGEEKSSSSSK